MMTQSGRYRGGGGGGGEEESRIDFIKLDGVGPVDNRPSTN